MKLASYNTGGSTSWGVLVGERVLDIVSLGRNRKLDVPDSVLSLLRGPGLGWLRELVEKVDVDDAAFRDLSSVTLGPPITGMGKIVAIGRNYHDHASEGNIKLPQWPKIFPKFPSTVVGPNAEIVLPTMSSQVDFEVEVAVVLGARADRVPVERAMEHVAGYTVVNDVSARDIQFVDEQLALGKNFATFCPLGPVITTADELPDPANIGLRLLLNGETMQDASTASLIFSIPYLIAFLSYVSPLEPGDVIVTGTPAGVGCFRNPPVWLKAGDVIECEVDGVGVLSNTVVNGTGVVPRSPTHHA